MNFNDQQLAVFDAAITSTESLAIMSCAGSGKTTVGIELARILEGTTMLCAYGYDAGKDMEARASDLRPNERNSTLQIRTTNSIGVRAWMKHTDRFNFPPDKFKVKKILDGIADVQPLAAKYKGFLSQLISHGKRAGLGVLGNIDNVNNWFGLIEHYNLGGDFEGDVELMADCVNVAIGVYKKSLDLCRTLIDYDDQVLAPMYYEARFPRFDNVILDEAQDTSPLRLDMVLRLTKTDGRFIAIGDPNQSVMGFTGASNESMDEIIDMTSARVLPLSVSYRMPKSAEIHVQRLVPDMKSAEGNVEGRWLDVWLEPEASLPDLPVFWALGPFTNKDVILCRKTHPLVDMAYQMIRRHIPCRVEGRDIGAGLTSLASRFKIPRLADLAPKLLDYKKEEMERLNAQYKEQEAESVGDKVDTLLVLIDAVFDEGSNSIGALVSLITRIFGDTEDGKKPDILTLSTVHKAKGREWDRVFVLGLDDYMPAPQAKKPRELRQERNLKFVAISRHKQTFVNVHMPNGKRKGHYEPRKVDTARHGDSGRPGSNPSAVGSSREYIQQPKRSYGELVDGRRDKRSSRPRDWPSNFGGD